MTSFKYPMSVGDFNIDVATRKLGSSLSISKFGSRTALASGVEEDLWLGTPDTLVRLESAERMSVVSTDVDDALGGTGAEYVTVIGLDNTFSTIQEEVELDGTTPVLTIGTFLRVNLSIVRGSNEGANQGTITVTAEIASDVQDVIGPSRGYSGGSHWTVAKDQVAIIQSIHASGIKAEDIDFALKLSIPNITDLAYATTLSYPAPVAVNGLNYYVPSKTDLKFVAISGSNNTVASLNYSMLLLSN